jgi:hypothetical protein
MVMVRVDTDQNIRQPPGEILAHGLCAWLGFVKCQLFARAVDLSNESNSSGAPSLCLSIYLPVNWSIPKKMWRGCDLTDLAAKFCADQSSSHLQRTWYALLLSSCFSAAQGSRP